MFSNKEIFCSTFEAEIEKTFGRSIADAHIDEIYEVLGKMIKEHCAYDWKRAKDMANKEGERQVIYFSMEFLLGKMMTTNLKNLGIYEVVEAGLKEFNINLQAIIDLESDAGLGNGGLGRLAACYMDSLASLGYLGHGNSIRYEYGFFKQVISNNAQTEVPDQWLRLGNVWEVKKPYRKIDIEFYGHVVSEYRQGRIHYHLEGAEHINAVPYDMPMIGYLNGQVNTLRLWSAEPSNEILPKNKDFYTYLDEVKQLCYGLYPDDSTEAGKLLRLKQQYFFVSAGIQASVKLYLRMRDHQNLDDFAKAMVFQLNDTHPVLGIPEFMRILLDEYDYEWDQAWDIVSHTFAYTNHTIMQEALEKWPLNYLQTLLPRIYTIIEEINRRFIQKVRDKFHDENLVNSVSIIKDGLVHMTRLAIVGSYSVNGVAYLHGEILKNQVLANFYRIYPEKFTYVTNGITQRRFLAYCNPQLKQLLDETIGEEWLKQPAQLQRLLAYVDDKKVQEKFLQVKRQRKQILADYIKQHNGIEVDVNSIFDIQVKRLHAYKRQLLNILHIIALYQYILAHPEYRMYPRTFIFGAKAAPSYVFAKKVIELINCVASVVNADLRVNKLFKVVFIENYDVTKAEIIVPACDVSEQISTAGKEASGTGNMKMMMNGALTFGTYDGANVEISNLVGQDYCLLFGMTEAEVRKLRLSGKYHAGDYYANDKVLKKALDTLLDGTFHKDKNHFLSVFNEIMLKNDEYYVLADFKAYVEAFMTVDAKYLDQEYWAKMCLINIAKSAYFSSDRAIQEYVDKIWHLNKVR